MLTNAGVGKTISKNFFSLRCLSSGIVVNPILDRDAGHFIPNGPNRGPHLGDHPLILVTPSQIDFVPFSTGRRGALTNLCRTLPNMASTFITTT